MTSIDLELLLQASRAGGPSNLASVTELEPAAGQHASVAPAKFVSGQDAVFAYEPRYLDGEIRTAVLIDSKQSQLNRVEAELVKAIDDRDELIARLPRMSVTYKSPDGEERTFSDLQLPHRAFDAHFRAARIDGKPVSADPRYIAARNSTPADAGALLALSPVTVLFGGWDATRKTRQWRGRSLLVSEIIGFTADTPGAGQSRRGGARVDPVGMKVELAAGVLGEIAESLKDDLSAKTLTKAKNGTQASVLGFGGQPPALDGQLGAVACDRIIRSSVLSFASLRQLRFGAGAQGDAAIRALLAALGLAGLARSDAELNLRANCDLRESGPSAVTVDQRGGRVLQLNAITVADADTVLAAALDHASAVAGLSWSGQVFAAQGDPRIVAGAVDTMDPEEG